MRRLSENVNPASFKAVEDNLIAYAKTCHGLPVQEVRKRILSAAQSFAAGATQHDDMTLVVLRVT